MQGTRERILEAAERLFAERGLEATSLRAITAMARVNLAAVHYHFGSKDGLIEAIFARRVEPLNRERLDRLTTLEARAVPPGLEEIVEAFVGPALRLVRRPDRGGAFCMRLLGRTIAVPVEALHARIAPLFDEVRARYARALRRLLPHVGGTELAWRIHFMVGAMLFTMSKQPEVAQRVMNDGLRSGVHGGRRPPRNEEAAVRRLVRFVAGGLRGPTPRRMRSR
ncbi:MAG: TetR/AcrR family transcriptional regulator [Planctomycetes bacterium]|nr:TetR/AcrR family transcriptional regulator [Planctomycetota bacterium]